MDAGVTGVAYTIFIKVFNIIIKLFKALVIGPEAMVGATFPGQGF